MTENAEGRPLARGITRITLRPLASSLPLGFFAFGMGTVLLTASELGWVPLTQQNSLLLLTLIVVAPLEIISGIIAFLARDSGAATALTLLGAVWAGVATVALTGAPGARTPVLAIFLLTLTPMLLGFAIGAMRGKPAFGMLMLVGACRFALIGVYQASGGVALERASGWLGIPIGLLGLYGGIALLLEDASGRTVLPIGRVGPARLPGGELAEQLERVGQEAGIRSQL